MPTAPKATPPKKNPLPQANQVPSAAPPAHKPEPVFDKKPKPLPKPKIVPNLKTETIPQRSAIHTVEPERAVDVEFEPTENSTQPTTEEETPTASFASSGYVATQVESAPLRDSGLESFSKLIRERINKVKRYPRMARKAGKQGTVLVEFSLNRQGELLESRVLDSCGTKALDKAALKSLNRASPFVQLPDSLTAPHTFRVQIKFSLDG